MRVLVVDDHADIGTLLGVWLRSAGHDVVAAVQWSPDLEGGGPYDAALVDLHLGAVDGREVARRLERAGLAPSRIAFMTSESGAALGSRRVFVKPFTLAEVSGWLRALGGTDSA